MSSSHNSNWKTRLVEGEFPDRSFDIEFWQQQGDEAIFSAAWDLVELTEELKTGKKPVFQKTVTVLNASQIALWLEVGEMGARLRVPRLRCARLLGTERLSHAWRSLERTEIRFGLS